MNRFSANKKNGSKLLNRASLNVKKLQNNFQLDPSDASAPRDH